MKGTAPRGRTLAEDRYRAAALQASAKQRAENVMIVDMVRNDLGRVAEIGSIDVAELFAVERYPTVWQMTSRITAKTGASLPAIFEALFPPASVTGAPKIRTAEIIRELERAPRGVYTGAIGHIAPGGDARFSVAIRTATIDRARGVLHFAVGSGIVWDSEAEQEHEECLLKAAVLGRRSVPFELLETLRWTPGGGFFLLDRHLERLRDSAEYFGFECPLDEIRAGLDAAVRSAGNPSMPFRARLLLGRDGSVRTEVSPLQRPHSAGPAEAGAFHEPGALLAARLAREPIDENDVFLFHKTTNRRVYEEARFSEPECDEVILWNTRGQVTEATTANVVVERDGLRVTPPVSCGLLGGTFRAELLARGEIAERVITTAELLTARRVWLVNSVHEWREAVVGRDKEAYV
jgi:para-aminobenzoate synthetase/4-amino-4-deoxychorismate lyase